MWQQTNHMLMTNNSSVKENHADVLNRKNTNVHLEKKAEVKPVTRTKWPSSKCNIAIAFHIFRVSIVLIWSCVFTTFAADQNLSGSCRISRDGLKSDHGNVIAPPLRSHSRLHPVLPRAPQLHQLSVNALYSWSSHKTMMIIRFMSRGVIRKNSRPYKTH